MKFLVAVLIVSCGGTAVTPSPTPAPPVVTQSPAPTFNAKQVTVGVTFIRVGDDAMPGRIANYLAANLGPAWSVATTSRGALLARAATGFDDVLVVVDSSMNPRQPAWGMSSPQRLIVLHEIEGAAMDVYAKVVVHEMGHVLGCCKGDGSDGTHVAGCPASTTLFPPKSSLMCPNGGDAPTFNAYELAQMGF